MSGRVYLVGSGPGSPGDITPAAADVLKKVAVIIGQKECLDLVWKYVVGKEVIASPMTPVERAGLAVKKAMAGQEDVAVVSTGDTGIYAIASTFFSYLRDNGIKLEVEIIPGVTLASAAAALLGSPLGHDFAVISLADLATRWRSIKRRLVSAAESDFVVVLYNPVGKVGGRRVREAVDIMLNYRDKDTPVGIVTGATTEQQKVTITTLVEVSAGDIDTDTIIITGNSETYVFNGKMVTPRGYIKGIGY
jgi:precorrin-3B C17-methyltransferase